ncbi:MAG: DNA internalization-related competence protein ComEC/Rec2 [Oscillospiraceae bacterium]|nr:DNA internalization-related competence protein ComEC/Rec2 [Oscillospiraceae bacterium]
MKRPLLTFALPFGLGVFAAQYLLPQGWQFCAAAAVLLLGCTAAWFVRAKRSFALVVALGLSLGIAWLACYGALFLAPMEAMRGMEMSATLELIEYPEQTDYGSRCTVRVDGIRGKVVYYGDASLLALEPGDTLRGTVRCYSAVQVGGTESTYYTSRGIFLRLYPVGKMEISRASDRSLRYLPQYLEKRLCTAVENTFDEETRGLILALLTGERDWLSEQHVTDLEESGLMHLTAVSGLHCGFLIALLSLLVGNNRLLRLLIAYPLLLLYMMVVGCTPSVVRACVMVGFVIAAPLFERESDAPTSLGAAMLVILLANPYAVASVSFQLSFASVAGLLTFSPRIYSALVKMVSWKNRRAMQLWRVFCANLSVSVSALVFTAPISAYYFRNIAVVSPLSNLLVMQVMSVLFACALLVTLACVIVPGAVLLAFVPEVLAKYVLLVAGLCAKLPGHAVSFGSIAVVMWLLLVYTMLAVCLIKKEGWRTYLFAAALALISLRAAQLLPIKLVENDRLTVVAVDVGQGAATLLHSRGSTALVDCGSHYCLRGSGAAVVDAMRLYGWETLDYVVLTHYHKDHAGGVDELLARVSAQALLVPRASDEDMVLHDEVIALAREYGIAVNYIDDVMELELGHSCVTVYPQLTVGKTNEEGLTVLCSAGEFDLLVTGDMSSATERKLVERCELPEVEVLMVGHHGSKHSTSEDLLRVILPEVGDSSVGDNNYGHPTPEAMERMAYYGCELYRTDWQGNIVIRVHE